MNQRLWIVPSNTLENKTIIELLLRTNEFVLTTKQTSSPSWENLEEKIQTALSKFDPIYGVQLQGKSTYPVLTISHYIHEKTQKPVYALEQVANLLDTPLTTDEQFILANNFGFSAMTQLGHSLHMTTSDTFKKIQEVRLKDRQCQGITQAEENHAIEAISQALNGLPKTGDKYPLISISLSHTKYSTVIDRLYGMYENLLITDPDNISHFYGSKDVLEQLTKDFEEGTTDGKETNGFYYWESPVDAAAIQNSIQRFLDQRTTLLEDERIKHLTPHDILNEQNIDEKVGRVMIKTPNLKHLSAKPGLHPQRVSREFYENGSIYSQEGTAIIEIKDKLHFMDEIENSTQWEEPQKISDYPLSYEEKILVLMNNGQYPISNPLLSKTSNRTLIPDMINLLRHARFNPEQFQEDIKAAEEQYRFLYQEVTKLQSNFQSFVHANRKEEKPFPEYIKWCESSQQLASQESTLLQLKKISDISDHFDSVIQEYETLYFKQNRPKTSSEKNGNAKKEGLEPIDD